MVPKLVLKSVLLLSLFVATTAMDRVPEGSAEYRDGWLQGCFEGYTAGGWKGYDYHIDADRLAADAEYRTGRDDALLQCYKEASARPKDIGPGG